MGDVRKANPRDKTSIDQSVVRKLTPLKRRIGSGVAQSKAEYFIGQFTHMFNTNEHSQYTLLDRSALSMVKYLCFQGRK